MENVYLTAFTLLICEKVLYGEELNLEVGIFEKSVRDTAFRVRV